MARSNVNLNDFLKIPQLNDLLLSLGFHNLSPELMTHSLPEKFEQNSGNNAFRNHLIDVDKMIVYYFSECILNG